MSNLDRLFAVISEDTRTKQIVELVKSPTPAIALTTGMPGAQDCFVLSSIFKQTLQTQIYLASDKEDAAYSYNTLCNLVGDSYVHFFPDSFKKPRVFDELKSNHVQQRTELVNKLNLHKDEPSIIVCYPESIFEKVVDPELLEKNQIKFKTGEQADIDYLIELMVEFGFERVEFVYEPGQFSVRGGIVDVFSYGNEWPYRIELFDDEVESIRTFNPTNQLSVSRLKQISIIPNINQKFKQSEKVSIFKILNKNSGLWIKDLDMLMDRLQMCFAEAEKFSKTFKFNDDEELKNIFNDRSFIYPDEIVNELISFNMCLLKKPSTSLEYKYTLPYEAKAQPSFNKQFELLINDLQRKEQEGYENFMFTDSSKQIERFYNIFEDLNAEVKFHPVNTSIHAGFIDPIWKTSCYTDHQIFERFHRYKLKSGFTKEQAISLKMLRELKPGDFVTHIDHGIGKYSGLEKIDINGHTQESVRLIYLNNDVLYVSINSLHKISKYVGKDGTAPRLSKIGGDAWKSLKQRTKRKVKDIAKELIKLYAQRKKSEGHAFPPDGYLQNELEASFIYEDTPDQLKATNDVKGDMEKANPMDRLICGDVGFGKTEVAMRAAFKAVVGGKQVAILVPTTILALQHYKTFSDRLKNFATDVDYVNRFRTTRQKTEIYKKLEEGKIDIIIGTHALLNKKVKFKDLGLLIIDEEQKFGVAAKEKLRSLKVNVDTLTLTATPIPRTLQFSLMAARDLSIIRTPPPNRQPIHTERRVFNDDIIRESIYYEVNRGGQVFFVHNRVKTLPDMAALVKRLCPDVDVAMAHGQMESKQLEEKLLGFINKDFDVLVCTNIIETGLDIPSANTIIINNAHQFGMSDLHQLRGRVGRSNRKAFCYLFAPPLSVLTSEARKRIQTLEEFSDLGSGFEIAMKDLDIRGAGNLLGGEQSGFIADIGFETYQKILEEAIHELKENEFKDLFKEEKEEKRDYVRDVEIDTDIEMLIPDGYIQNIQERLRLYTEMNSIEDEDGLILFRDKLKDRFGPVPRQIDELFNGLRLRWQCKQLGFERLSLKNRKLRCFFIANAQSSFFESDRFNEILKYISTDGQALGLNLKQSRNYLIVIKDGVKNLKEANVVLNRIQESLTS